MLPIKSRFGEKIDDLQKALEVEKKRARDARDECDKIKAETGVQAVESRLREAEESRSIVEKEKASVKAELQRTQEELLEVANELVSMKEDQDKFIDVALEEERKETEELRKQLAVKDDRIAEEVARYREALDEKAVVEEELQDREFWMAEYEKGHGLSDAVVYQKKLKGDIKRRDKEIRRLNGELSDRIASYEKLWETARRLKIDGGLGEDYEYDDLEIQEGMKGQSERYKALCKELEQQNDTLENERLRLLKALRLSAQQMGEKGMKFYGLSAQQIVQVNEFAEGMRDGTVELPLDDKSLELQKKCLGLERELREARRDIAALEVQLEKGPQYSSSISDETAGANQSMERQLAMVAEQQTQLQSLVQRQLLKDGEKSPKKDSRVNDMLNLIQEKLDGGVGLDGSQMKKMQSEIERLSGQNQALADQLVRVQESAVKQVQAAQSRARAEYEGKVSSADAFGLTSRSAPGERASLFGAPSTATAQRIFEQSMAGVRLPPEEWAEKFESLNAQVFESLEWVLQREKEANAQHDVIEKMERALETVTDQMTLLYREHVAARAHWNEDVISIRAEADEARAERDALQVKAQRFDTMCATLEGGGDENLRDTVRDLSRKLAVHEVNEVVLARRYNLLAEQDRTNKMSKEMLERDIVLMESALKERVLYLEQWKRGAQAEINRLHGRVDKCILRDTHKETVSSLVETKARLRNALAENAELAALSTGARALRRRVKELESSVDISQTEITTLKRLLNAEKERVAWMQNRSEDGAGAGEEVSLETVEDYVREIAKLRGEALEKEIRRSGTVKTLEKLKKRLDELDKAYDAEVERSTRLEETTKAAKAAAERATKEALSIKSTYLGGASRAERAVFEDRIAELEEMYGSLAREAERSKEMADIASSQAQALDAMYSGRQYEFKALEEQLRDVNSRTDDDAIIGKLQHQLTSVKVNYQMFVRKYDILQVELKRRELNVQKLDSY